MVFSEQLITPSSEVIMCKQCAGLKSLTLYAPFAVVIAALAVLAMTKPPRDRTPAASRITIISAHHHPQHTDADGVMAAEAGDQAEVFLSPSARMTQPFTSLIIYCSSGSSNDQSQHRRYTDVKRRTRIHLDMPGYCRIVLVDCTLPSPPLTGQFDGDILRLRSACSVNPLFGRIRVAP